MWERLRAVAVLFCDPDILPSQFGTCQSHSNLHPLIFFFLFQHIKFNGTTFYTNMCGTFIYNVGDEKVNRKKVIFQSKESDVC